MKIEDGTGSGRFAAVDTTKRLKTAAAVSSALHENSINEKQVYIFSTGGFISITSTGTETGVFYLKNTSSTKYLFINSIRTCGTQIQKVLIYKDPTGGTLISTANAAESTNLNLTSSNTSESTQYYGANALTVTGGTHIANHINHVGHSTMNLDDALVLGKNNSIAITFEVDTAADVCVAIEGYYATE